MKTRKVGQVMTAGAETIEPNATLQLAAGRMKDIQVGFLMVYEEGSGLLGVITDRDIVVRAIAEGAPPTTSVRDVMTLQAVWCYEDAALSEAVALMELRGVRRLVVLDEKLRLAGVLSVDDVARAEEQPSPAAEVVRLTSQRI
jgi:CBS domain-containing protein